MKGTDDNPKDLRSFEDCRMKLESLFEEKFMPERDFFDYILMKKSRNFEDMYNIKNYINESIQKKNKINQICSSD